MCRLPRVLCICCSNMKFYYSVCTYKNLVTWSKYTLRLRGGTCMCGMITRKLDVLFVKYFLQVISEINDLRKSFWSNIIFIIFQKVGRFRTTHRNQLVINGVNIKKDTILVTQNKTSRQDGMRKLILDSKLRDSRGVIWMGKNMVSGLINLLAEYNNDWNHK